MEDIIHIKEPFFTAGKKYKWPGKAIGLGIDLKLMQGDGKIRVKVGNSEKVWWLSKLTARDFCQKHQSYFQAKTVRLGVIAWHHFLSEENNIQEVQQTLL